MFVKATSDCIDTFCNLADAFETFRDQIIEILSDIETKKTAINELDKTVKTLRTYGHERKYIEGRVPVGKVAVFLPFNMPLYSMILYAFGSLYAGNEVYVRPSRITKNVLLRIYSLFKEIMAPLPLYIVSNMSGKAFWERSMADESVNTVVFTGQWESVEDLSLQLRPGKKLIYCGSGLCSLIVRSDADLDEAVDATIKSRIFTSGQDCLATEKIFVHSDIYDDFIVRLNSKVDKLIVGDNHNIETDIGQLATTEFVDRIQVLLSSTQGEIVRKGRIGGSYVEPIIVSTKIGDPLFEEEKFSPIFTIARYYSELQIIEYINSCEYSMGVSIFGSRLDIDSFQMDHVLYNRTVLDYEEDDAHIPFGGYKKSGFVLKDGHKHGGPILFSYETTKNKGE